MPFSFDIKPLRRKAHVGFIVTTLMVVLGSCTPTAGPSACARPDIAFTGDVLLHAMIQSEAAARPEGFAPAFAAIAPFLSRASVAVVNLEGPTATNIASNLRTVADPGTRFDGRVYTGYPRFNYHPSVLPVLRNAGVDIVQTANNHALDRGSIGVDLTLQAVAEAGLRATGTRLRGSTDPFHIVRQIGGRNIAFLACTFSTNSLADPAQQSLSCYGNSPSIPELIQSLTVQTSIDSVILLPHWGAEYTSRPTAQQRRLAQAAADAGAAAIVGAHPHVLQPIETLTASDGRSVPVAYSLGNLISTQWREERRTGAVLYLDINADAQGRVVATAPRYLPTRVERTVDLGVAVFPAAQLPSGTQSIAHAQRILGPRMVDLNGCLAR